MFIREGDAFVATVSSQGPWNPKHTNGGSALALLGHCLDDVPTLAPMTMTRFTADLMRPVPLSTRLHVHTNVAREGKKIQIVDLSLVADGLECVRATVLRVRNEDLTGREGLPPDTTQRRPATTLRPPEECIELRSLVPNPSGALHAMDVRKSVRNDSSATGTWLRIVAPVIAGEAVRTSSRMGYAFDFTNLVGVGMRGDEFTMINPDVSAQILREPVGEWIALTGETRFDHRLGHGVSDAELSDDEGVWAVTSTSQIVQPRSV